MKITFFAVRINLESGGGSHRTLDLKLRYLLEKGHEVKLVTVYSGGNKGVSSVPYSIDEFDLKGKSFNEVQNFVVEEMKKREKVSDIYYMDGGSFIWAGGMYRAQKGKVPTVAFVNNYQTSMGIHKKTYSSFPYFIIIKKKIIDSLYRMKRAVWEKTIGIKKANYLDKIYFDSPIIQDLYVKWGINRKITGILPEFVNIDKFSIQQSTHNPFENTFNILYVGRFSYDKGIDLLLKAVSLLSLNNIKLHLVGDGPYKDEIRKFVSKENLSNSIVMHTWKSQQDLINYYKNADVFVHPSRWPEPFGCTVLEAMACGAPILTSTGTGATWLVGDSGLHFKNGDLFELIKKLEVLIKDETVRKTFSEKSKIRAREFNYKNFVSFFENELLELKSNVKK